MATVNPSALTGIFQGIINAKTASDQRKLNLRKQRIEDEQLQFRNELQKLQLTNEKSKAEASKLNRLAKLADLEKQSLEIQQRNQELISLGLPPRRNPFLEALKGLRPTVQPTPPTEQDLTRPPPGS